MKNQFEMDNIAASSSFEQEDLDRSYNQYDDTKKRYRTTSMHRNVNVKPPLQTRTLPRSLEDRREWMEYDRSHRDEVEYHAHQIAERMGKDNALNQNNLISEELRKEALRSMPQLLTVKRQVKEKLSKSISLSGKKRGIGWHKSWKYNMSIKYSKMILEIKNSISFFVIWNSTLKNIEGHFGSGISSYFKFFRWLFFLNAFTMIIALIFIVVPQMIIQASDNNTSISSNFSVEDIFTGEGYFTNTILFYGFYTDNSLIVTGNMKYQMNYAYFFTMIIVYGCYLAIFGSRLAQSYRKSYIETKGGLKNVFANKIFCAWDYGIATEEAAKLKHLALYHELRERLSEMHQTSNRKKIMEKLRTFFIRLATNSIIILLMSGVSYLIWTLLKNKKEQDDKSTSDSIITAVVINIIIIIFPLIFRTISRYEDYKSPKYALYMNLFRIFLLEIILIGILITFWISNNDSCWETSLGQEVYRLIIFDFLFSIIFTLIFEIGRYILFKNIWDGIGCQEFDIAGQTLQLVYNQTLFWVGFYFSPLLILIIVLKLFLIWYIKSYSLLLCCKPSSKSWRAAQAYTWFLTLSLICLLTSISILGYVIFYVNSSDCGPLRFGIKGILNVGDEDTLWHIIKYIFKPGFIAIVLIALCTCIYYQRAKAQAQVVVVKMLRDMLAWEAKDKDYLLNKISKITKGNWQYNLIDGRDDFYDPYKMLPKCANNASNAHSNLLVDPLRQCSSYDFKEKRL